MACDSQRQAVEEAQERLRLAKEWLHDLTGSDDVESTGWVNQLGGTEAHSEAGGARKAVKEAQSALREAQHHLRNCLEQEKKDELASGTAPVETASPSAPLDP